MPPRFQSCLEELDTLATIVVAGWIVRYPLAASVWHYLNYVLGFQALGHDVYFLEEANWENSVYNPETEEQGNDPTYGLRYLDSLAKSLGFAGRWVYVDRAGRYHGMTRRQTESLLRRTDFLLNCGGVCWLPEFTLAARLAYLDEDPGFIQFEAAQGGPPAREPLSKHNLHFTYARNMGKPGCRIPAAGFDWKPTTCPLVTAHWTPHVDASLDVYTTVMSWRSYGGTIRYQGESFGQKDIELLRFIEVPRHVRRPIELAIGGAGRWPSRRLRRMGWRLRDSTEVTRDMAAFRDYVRGSRGEFSVAKNCYVKSWSGWFSQRTILYMASAKPVIVQDTGFSEWLPAGEGVIAFTTFDDIVAGFEAVESRYEEHCRAARAHALRWFDSRTVLGEMLAQAGLDPVGRSSAFARMATPRRGRPR